MHQGTSKLNIISDDIYPPLLQMCRIGCNLAAEIKFATLLAVIATAKSVAVAVNATAKSVAVAVDATAKCVAVAVIATAKSVAVAVNCYSQMCRRVCKMSQLR